MKYFLHDTNAFNDEKVTELFMKFGYEGLGLFYTILEKFASQEKPIKTDVIKSQLKIGKRLNKCWKFMEEIDLIQSVNGESFNKQLLNFSESYQIKKEKTRIKVAEWREKQANKENVTGYVPVSNPPKVKKSKVKESKVIKNPFHSKMKTVFMDFYKSKSETEYYWTGTDGNHINQLTKKLISKIEESGKIVSCENLTEIFKVLLNKLPEWYLTDGLSVSVINSKFNEIITQIKTKKSGSKQITDEDIERHFANEQDRFK